MWRLFAFAPGPVALLVAQSGVAEGIPSWVYVVVPAVTAGVAWLASGKVVVMTYAYNREVGRADKWEAEAQRLNADAISHTSAALAASGEGLREASAVMQRVLDYLPKRRG